MNESEKKPTETETQAAPVTASSVADATPLAAQPAQVAGESGKSAQKPEDQPVGTLGRVIKFKYPFKSGDKTLNEVTFPRRPKAKDLIVSADAKTLAEQELYGIASVLGIIPEDLMEMDGADYLAVEREWAAFLGQ